MAYEAAIDVSRYQGAIDWAQISEPIAIIKMSGGDSGVYMDSKAVANYEGAIRTGKAVGGYHFAGGGDPVVEANYFIRAMSPLVENDVYALDWEIQHPDPVGWCNTFMHTVHDKIGVWPLLYINLSTLRSYDWSAVLVNCGLWLAAWNNDPEIALNTNGRIYVMQQYNDGPWCDHDAWFGTIDQFKAYGWHAPVVAPPTPVSIPAPAPVSVPEPAPIITVTPVPTPVLTPVELPPTTTVVTTPITTPSPVSVTPTKPQRQSLWGFIKLVLSFLFVVPKKK